MVFTEERSGIYVSSQLTVEAEHTYDEVHANVVLYYSENQNFDGKDLQLVLQKVQITSGFYNSGDDQRIRLCKCNAPNRRTY